MNALTWALCWAIQSQEIKFQLSVQVLSEGLPSSLSLEPITKPRKVRSISVWMSAFRIFVGVYTKKHPHKSPALMKYSDIVQDLADRGHNWQFYHEKFSFPTAEPTQCVALGTYTLGALATISVYPDQISHFSFTQCASDQQTSFYFYSARLLLQIPYRWWMFWLRL